MIAVCLIVDAYSTGKNLAPALEKVGIKSIHLQSSSNLPSSITKSFKGEDFLDSFVYEGNTEKLIEMFREKGYEVVMCLPGSESGVEASDEIAAKLNLFGNGTILSAARRDKYKMIEVIKQSGLDTVEHFKSNNIDKIIKQVEKWDRWPIVVKPLRSASGNNVRICYTMASIKEAYNLIMQSSNLFGETNNEVLIEDYNEGQEYIINTVSWEGNPLFVEIWKINKLPSSIVYDTAEILRSENEAYAPIASYVKRVLLALEIRYGAATTELKYRENSNRPVIVECAARLMGAAPLEFSQEIFGFTQLSLLIEAYTNPKNFLKRISAECIETKKDGIAVLLISPVDGILLDNLDIDSLKLKLKTFHSADFFANKRSVLHRTIDTDTCPGIIYLAGDKEDIQKDLIIIRRWEETIYRRRLHEFLILGKDIMREGLKYGIFTPLRNNTIPTYVSIATPTSKVNLKC